MATDKPSDRQKLRHFTVATRFGDVNIDAYDIADARRDVKERFRITNPEATRERRVYMHCDTCDSAPCVCE